MCIKHIERRFVYLYRQSSTLGVNSRQRLQCYHDFSVVTHLPLKYLGHCSLSTKGSPPPRIPGQLAFFAPYDMRPLLQELLRRIPTSRIPRGSGVCPSDTSPASQVIERVVKKLILVDVVHVLDDVVPDILKGDYINERVMVYNDLLPRWPQVKMHCARHTLDRCDDSLRARICLCIVPIKGRDSVVRAVHGARYS